MLQSLIFSPVVSATFYKLSQQQQFKKPLSFLWKEQTENYKGKLSCLELTGMFSGNERKRDNVGSEKSYMQISSNSV